MGRPLDTEKRRDLARRAVEILHRDGLEGTSMTGLATALGLKRPTLLYYFPTRAAIVEAALEELLAEQATHVLAAMAEQEHPIDQLHAQLRAVHAFHEGREERIAFLAQAVAASGAERLDSMIEVGNRVFDTARRAMVDRLRAAIAAGTVVDHDAEALVRVVRGLVDGLLVQRFMTGCDLAPVHRLVWERLLLPLKKDPA